MPGGMQQSPWETDQENPDEFFSRALTQMRTEQYGLAWFSIRRALTGYEELGESGLELGRCHSILGALYQRTGRGEAAVSEFSAAVTEFTVVLTELETIEDSDLARARVLLDLGIALAGVGSTTEAATALWAASELFLAQGEDRGVALCEAKLAAIDSQQAP